MRLSDSKVARLEMALIKDQDISNLGPGEFYGYPVDSGTGSFMDKETALIFEDIVDMNRKSDTSWNAYDDWLETDLGTKDMIMFQPDKTKPNNAAIFSSGGGDGVYPSYWGFDENNTLTCLITNFSVIDDFYDNIQEIETEFVKLMESKEPEPDLFSELVKKLMENIEKKTYFSYEHLDILSKLYYKRIKVVFDFNSIVSSIESLLLNNLPKGKENILYFYNRMFFLFNRGKDMENTIKICDRIISLEPDEFDSYNKKIDFLHSEGQYEQLVDLLENFFNKYNADKETRIKASDKLYDISVEIINQDSETALKILNKSLVIYQCHYTYEKVAELYEKNGDIQKAIEFYKKAIEYTPQDKKYIAPYINLSNCLIQHNQIEEALTLLEAGLSLDNKEPLIWHNRADAFFRSNRLQEARESALTAVSLYEKSFEEEGLEDADDYENLIEALYFAGEENKLHSVIDTYVKQYPDVRKKLGQYPIYSRFV